jgi:hypothetical protein
MCQYFWHRTVIPETKNPMEEPGFWEHRTLVAALAVHGPMVACKPGLSSRLSPPHPWGQGASSFAADLEGL